ncbi:hypothetical protein EC973_000374 [Apophysomyces ossiformis]|uniref:nicotinamidase n=1 Tax=Apophysomyces ossiformis TaxID=679940 RepID=A0A8H7BRU2_9FUNG|nr:hypothetical protein EC973_000374 [Apophysomyces ossiformis]
MNEKVALILVDIQYDFLETGSLPVPEASKIMPVVNKLIRDIKAQGGLIVATQDWHPKDHVSFASNHSGKKVFDSITLQYEGQSSQQTLWPDHCVQGSKGAELCAEMDLSSIDFVVQKGANRFVDSYSAFADNQYAEITKLSKILHQHSIEMVIVVGLAADYCVKMTCLDGVKFGFHPILVKEGTRGVVPNDIEPTMAHLQSKGVEVTSINDPSFVSKYLSSGGTS